MSIVSQAIRNLLGGVSKRTAQTRKANETVEQTNVLADYSRGLGGRPGSRFVAMLEDNGDLTGSAFIHEIERSPNEKYTVVVVDGIIRVFDSETGSEFTVVDVGSTAATYLAGTDPQKNIKMTTVDDTTYVTNRIIVTRKSTEKSPVQPKEALVYIRQADYSTTYTLIINGVTVDHITPPGTDPNFRQDIATNHIAEQLEEGINGAVGLAGVFDVTRFGSTLYIRRSDGADFSISGKDDLADGGMLVVKGSVQSFDQLPAFCKDGVVLEVVGDKGTDKDNYFVKYEDNGKPREAGVWKECVKPNVQIALDPATMPHRLVFNGSLAEGQSHGAPLVPSIYPGGGENTDGGWATTLEGTEGSTVESVQLSAVPGVTDTEERFCVLTDIPTGARTVTVYMDSTPLSHAAEFRVDFYYNEGPASTTWHLASSAGGWSDHQRTNTKRTLTVNTVAGASIKAVIQLRSDSPTTNASGTISLHGPDDSLFPGVSYVETPSTVVAFNPDEDYPEGFDFALELSVVTPTLTETFTYTALVGDTGVEIALGLKALIDADADWVATIVEDGVIDIKHVTPDENPGVAYSTTFDEDVNLFDPTQTFVVDALIGQTVENESDGSSATITDNSEHVITVAALAGGTNNTFAAEDFYRTDTGTVAFVFEPIDWDEREAGDDVTCKFPSFVGKGISDVFVYKTRLGVLSGNRLVFTRSGSTTNFFRKSARDIFETDRIDVTDAHGNVGDFHSHYLWNETLYISAHNAQLKATGPVTPQGFGLDVAGRFSASDRFRPLVMGNSVVVAVAGTEATTVWQHYFDQGGKLLGGRELTSEVKDYILGSPLVMVGSETAGIIAILTDHDSTVYVLSMKDDEQGNKLMQAWGKWTFNSHSTLNGLGMAGEHFFYTHSIGDETYLERIDLGILEDVDASDGLLLDQRATQDQITVTVPPGFGILDDFTGTAGNLDARVADTIGGTWTDTDAAFAVNGSGKLLQQGGDTGLHLAMNGVDIPWHLQTTKEAWFETTISAGMSGNWGIIFLGSKTNQECYWLRIAPSDSGAGWSLFNAITVNARASDGSDQSIYSEVLSYPTETAFGDYRIGVQLVPLGGGLMNVVIWMEPAGGGARTTLATWDGDDDLGVPDRLDSDHVRFGVLRQSSTGSCNWLKVGAPIDGGGNESMLATPYAVSGTAAEYVLLDTNGAEIDFTITGTHELTVDSDLSAADFTLGMRYNQQVDLSTLYKRDQNGEAITLGRLQLGYLDVSYRQSEAFTVRVTPLERTAKDVALSQVGSPDDGVLHVPVLARNIYAAISILNSTYSPWWITSLLWDGELSGSIATRGEVK